MNLGHQYCLKWDYSQSPICIITFNLYIQITIILPLSCFSTREHSILKFPSPWVPQPHRPDYPKAVSLCVAPPPTVGYSWTGHHCSRNRCPVSSTQGTLHSTMCPVNSVQCYVSVQPPGCRLLGGLHSSKFIHNNTGV